VGVLARNAGGLEELSVEFGFLFGAGLPVGRGEHAAEVFVLVVAQRLVGRAGLRDVELGVGGVAEQDGVVALRAVAHGPPVLADVVGAALAGARGRAGVAAVDGLGDLAGEVGLAVGVDVLTHGLG